MTRRLFEFSDQAWLPRIFRDLLTEALQHQLDRYRIYWDAVAKLNEVLTRAGCTEILDLCSGSGGPLLQLLPHTEASRLTLTDAHPNDRLVEKLRGIPGVTYVPYPVDARAVPADLKGCRTMFTGFHHFDEPDARRVLQNAVEARAPIAVFEFTDRAFARLSTLFTAAFALLRDTRDVWPRRWSRLFWTYVVPLMPLLYAWDTLASHVRTYAPKELRAMTVGFPAYSWETGTLPSDSALRITYLIGTPAREDHRN